MLSAQTEQGLEGRHGRAPSVEAKDVLVEVDLQVLLGDAAVGALQPRLEVADHAVDAGQDLVQVVDGYPSGSLGPGAVVVPQLAEPAVGVSAFGMHHAVYGDDLGDEAAQGRCRGVLNDLHANSA